MQPVVDAFDPRLLIAPSISHTLDFSCIKVCMNHLKMVNIYSLYMHQKLNFSAIHFIIIISDANGPGSVFIN